MKIDREHVKNTFREYTDAYDSTDEKVKLKIAHTYRVAGLCERIAQSEDLSADDVELSWLLGMLHDVGRFEQLRRYDTFNDAMSVDHAKLGVDILFGSENRIRDYIEDEEEDSLIETAIVSHSAYRIPEELDARTERFCHILRDADKIDILRVNVEVPVEAIYNTTTEDVQNAVVTEAVMDNFFTHRATPRKIRQNAVDCLVGHISLVYELVFPESLCIVKNDGYLERLLHFESRNSQTQEQFAVLRREMEEYLRERAAGRREMKNLNNKKFVYKKAGTEDIELLVKVRIEVLRAANRLSDDTDMSFVEQQSRKYYEEFLQTESHTAYLVFDGAKVIGAGGVSFFRVMPTYHNPTGWKAYIMNMYTNPDYRRKGIAYHMLELLTKDAKSRGIQNISLEATDMGRPLYERYGFVSMKDEMELPEERLV